MQCVTVVLVLFYFGCLVFSAWLVAAYYFTLNFNGIEKNTIKSWLHMHPKKYMEAEM